MARLLQIADLPGSKTASRFEGREHGSPVSFFLTRHPPGAGVPLHRHPYAETFIVQEGAATFTVGEEKIDAEPGEVVIVPAETPHGFESCGDGPLRMVSIHPSDHVIQEWLE